MRTHTLYLAAAPLWAVAVSQDTSQAQYPISGPMTGINNVTGERPARKNINDIYNALGPEWDLFIQALAEFQNMDESDEISYFQIAGIHGRPYVSWNGVENVDGAKTTGYCPHSDILFAPWHRPYLALFEQELVNHAAKVAEQYPNDTVDTYRQAAQTLRLPFWDWASDYRLPPAVTSTNVTVNGPQGPTTLPNPLYKYRFRNTSLVASWNTVALTYTDQEVYETMRCPNDPTTNENNATQTDTNLQSYAAYMTSLVWDVFARTPDFNSMSTSNSNYTSFEDPHGIIHAMVGCYGTMRFLQLSSFEPIFWLHHSNVDRLIAMWEAIYYNNAALIGPVASTGQFGIPEGTAVYGDTPLKPFYNPSLQLYDSDSVTHLWTFGYTYPEIDYWTLSQEELANSVLQKVNQLYGPQRGQQNHNTQRSEPASQVRRGIVNIFSWLAGNKDGGNRGSPTLTLSKYYTASIQVDRSQLPLPCTIDLLIDGKGIGRMAVLNMPATGTATQTIPVSDMLSGLSDDGLKDLNDVAKVSQFLTSAVKVKITGMDGTEKPLAEVPSLKVQFKSTDYTPAVDLTSFPKFGESELWSLAISGPTV